jgi:hypothetical protein
VSAVSKPSAAVLAVRRGGAALQRGFVEQQELRRQGRGSGAAASVARPVKASRSHCVVLARDGRGGVLGAELDASVREGGSAVPGLADLDREQVVQVQTRSTGDPRCSASARPSRSCRCAARRCSRRPPGRPSTRSGRRGCLGGVGRSDDRVDPDRPDAVLAEQPVGGVEDPGAGGWAAGGRHENQNTTDRFVYGR